MVISKKWVLVIYILFSVLYSKRTRNGHDIIELLNLHRAKVLDIIYFFKIIIHKYRSNTFIEMTSDNNYILTQIQKYHVNYQYMQIKHVFAQA